MSSQDEQWLLKEKYRSVESEAFYADLKRLAEGEPLAYVIGHLPFLGCQIFLDSHPLIPRSETEYWVEKAISEIKKQTHRFETESLVKKLKDNESVPNKGIRVLDLCAGSGAIGIAVAKAIPEAHVTFGEIDQAHLPTIAKNLEANDIPCTRYQVFQSDLFERISGSFDFILSNPPYIDPKIDRTEKSVKEHEPYLALYGGKDGTELIERIIAGARAKIAPHGKLWLEHEPEQTSTITLCAKKHNFSISTHPDQYDLLRYSVLVLQ